MPRCPTSKSPGAFNAHNPGDGGSGLVQPVFRSSARIPAAETTRRGLCRRFCFGGGIINQLAVRMGSDLGAAVPFYGAQPSAAETAKITAPINTQCGELDRRITGMACLRCRPSALIEEVRFARDSSLEGAGFEPVWGFSCQGGCFGFAESSLFGAGKPFFVPSPAIRFAERAEGVKGPKR